MKEVGETFFEERPLQFACQRLYSTVVGAQFTVQAAIGHVLQSFLFGHGLRIKKLDHLSVVSLGAYLNGI